MNVFDILTHYSPTLLGGLWVTIKLFLLTSAIGITFGVLLGALGARHKSFGTFVRIFSFVLAGIPLLVILFWFYYPFQTILGISISPFSTAVIALAFFNVAIVAELIRGVLVDFPKQYIVVAQMSDLSPRDIFSRIQFPMVFRQVIPSLLTTQVFVLHATLFASLIAVPEIFRVAQNINAVIYKPIEIYTALALFFIITLAPVNYIAYELKRRYTRDFSEY
ncbi:ABC transporter permease subunit [bacterium]|nr:ABC transporter permease subunit [bacterium]